MHYADIAALPAARFKRLTGVAPDTFQQMVAHIEEAWRNFGRPCKLSRHDQVLLTLSYWREYRSLAHLAATYRVSEPTVLVPFTVSRTRLWHRVSSRCRARRFCKNLTPSGSLSWWTRPRRRLSVPKKQQKHYSGKKMCHTIKSQVVIDKATDTILATCFSCGKTGDMHLLRASKLALAQSVTCYADLGYQGLHHLFPKADVPVRKPPKGELTLEQKQSNQQQRKERVCVEHTMRRLKVFRILAGRYRNHRKRFCLRFNLIAALINQDVPKHCG